jgi:nucleoside-diphosphate-sugar epimerase
LATSRRILVTGATGLIGSHLTQALERDGYSVVRFSSSDGDIAHGVLDYAAINHVFHLAARTSVPESWLAPRSFYETNVLGTVNVLELCRNTGASLTYVSSYIYGPPQRLPIDEQHPVSAFNPYSSSKILAEEAARFYAASFRVPVTIIRPFNVYGPEQTTAFLIPSIIKQALSPETQCIEVADDRPKRDHLYVSDLVDLLLCTMDGGGLRTYNAGSGYSVSIPEIVGLVNELLHITKPLVSRGEGRPFEVMNVIADIARARAELGWRPQVLLREGLQRTIWGMMKTPSDFGGACV